MKFREKNMSLFKNIIRKIIYGRSAQPILTKELPV